MPRLAPPLARCAPLIAALLLAACNSAEEPDEAPTPTPRLTTQAVPTTSAEGAPLTAGSWTIEETAGGASAAFGEAGRQAALVLVCTRNTGAVTLSRPGAGQEPQTFTLQAGDQRAAVQMSTTSEPRPALEAQIDPTQPIFAAFIDRGESIEIGAPGAAALRIPGHPGISRVIEACR